MVGDVKSLGTITKDFPFLSESHRTEIESVMKTSVDYWDFSVNISKIALEKECHPNIVYLALYHASRLENNEAVRKIRDAHRELPIPYPFFQAVGCEYSIDLDLVEESIELNQNIAITFYMLMRLYRVTDVGSPEEERTVERIKELLAQNQQLRLLGADYLGHTGFRLKLQGRPVESFEHMMQAFELARESGDKWHQASLLTLIAEVSAQYKKGTDTFSKARKYLGEAMELCKEINDRAGTATALQNMCVFAYSRGELGEAFDCQLEAIMIEGELGDVNLNAASNIAGLYARSGDKISALEWAKYVLDGESELGPYAPFCMASTHLALGNIKEAEKYLDRARELTLSYGLETALGRLYRFTGKLERLKGDLESAMDSVRRALDINERASRQLRVRVCMVDLAEIELDMFVPTKANRDDEYSGPWMKKLEEEVEKNDIPGIHAHLLLLKSELRMRQGRHEEAEDILESVLKATNKPATRFIHRDALQMKKQWEEQGLIPLGALEIPTKK